MHLQERLRSHLPAAFLVLLIISIFVNIANWIHFRPAPTPSFYSYAPVIVPAGVRAIGNFTVLLPAGGWDALLRQRDPRLEVEAWVAPARSDVRIQSWGFLLDGRELKLLAGRNEFSTDLVKQFDRLELYDAGWALTLALPPQLAPGPHTLAMQVTFAGGQQAVLKEVSLR